MSAKVYVIGKSVSNAICSVSRRRRLTATTGFVQVQAFLKSQGNLCSFNETILLFYTPSYAVLFLYRKLSGYLYAKILSGSKDISMLIPSYGLYERQDTT